MIRRQARKIHLGDNRFLDSREVQLEFLGESEDSDDEMETVARMSFTVSKAELGELVELGLLESATVPSAEEVRVQFRTDRDLLDEEDETLLDEWEATHDDPAALLRIWCDLEYWELQSANRP